MSEIFQLFLLPETYISLLSLTLLEIVLGIDNIIFISILAGKLPANQRPKARSLGLTVALVTRIILLCGIAWLTQLTKPLFSLNLLNLVDLHPSGKDLVLLAGGLFLIAKSAHEIYEKVEAPQHAENAVAQAANSLGSVIFQIVLIDMVFSLDSIITAVGLVDEIAIMMVAVVISMVIMLLAAGKIGEFIDRHPSIKILALGFLLMIGTMLVAEAFHYTIPKGYIYFSLTFALFVEFVNIKARTRKA
ncbi:MAG: TerC family protein, partial [Vampirovibrionales bacterium]|nr:TerC family protein [Vampirovibrionales bacterium]